MVYDTVNTATQNPFAIANGNQLFIDHYALEDLPNQELINYFVSLIDETFPYRNEGKNMIYNTSIFILTQSLDLNLYEDRTKAFVRIYDVLQPILKKA
jgi:hypothetical protein